MDAPTDIKNYELKDGEVKYICPKCNPETGEFLGIYETIGFLVVRGDPFEVFLNYGYVPQKSKVCIRPLGNKFPVVFVARCLISTSSLSSLERLI